jgi:hypothetical protein
MLDNKELKNIKAVFDGRNILSQSDFSPLNIRYFGIGNPLKK